MQPENKTHPVPSERHLRVLDAVRADLGVHWRVSPLRRTQHYRHWEDESAGIPPLGDSAGWFTVELKDIELTISTAFPWQAELADRLVASFHDYEDGTGVESWAIVMDAQARAGLSSAGFNAETRGRSWSLRESTDATEGIVNAVLRLDTVRLPRLLRRHLPDGLKWPWRGLVDVLASDEILSIESRTDAKYKVTSETDGRRTVTEVDARDIELVRWWQAGGRDVVRLT